MPQNQFNQPFTRGLDFNNKWALVFCDNKQQLYVDITTQKGKDLFNGVLVNNTAICRNEFSKNLVIAHNMLMYSQDKQKRRIGLDAAIRALNMQPSQAPARKILLAAGSGELGQEVLDICQNYLATFTENKEDYSKQDGYHNKLVAALIMNDHIRKTAEKNRDRKLFDTCMEKYRQYSDERARMVDTKRW